MHLVPSEVEFATEGDVKELLSCEVGSIGPVKLHLDLKVIADHSIASIVNGICGANEDGFHLINVNPERDFAVDRYVDFVSSSKEIHLQMVTEQLSLLKELNLDIYSN